ncbi:fungal-specific transcription factor domain-containing protein [Collybia nuda]|uniref:Fungal-specific transcription factor domain-containing protein n=1 Tax=Collybia nuda TaxID=64659 RepID=A0A9P5YCK1_9AGAR|nr:fungal-specific transcription factor domain-containing protein [Collybia nuda]
MPPITTAESQEQSSSSSSILKERRFKLSRACDRCRRRRIKCDEGHPCQACLTANSSCTFEEPGKRTHPHKSKRTATLEDRMHHLETLIQAIPPAVFAAGGILPPISAGQTVESATSPVAPFSFPSYPSGVPPPSLHVFPLTNPSTHFSRDSTLDESQQSQTFGLGLLNSNHNISPEQLAEDASRMSLTASYLYFDDEGYTRWQGETSGLPVLDLLVERHAPPSHRENSSEATATNTDWFPNRTPRRTDVNPETLWRLMTSYIVPELMDSLVQCYLSTSYYILPFLHVPSFLADYGNPQKWGEPGFAAFIVSICCLASRHIDDPRVRADANDGISAGTHWFELFGRLRTLPIADRPTLYNIQANLIAAVYAVGLGKLSKAASLLAEAVTMSIDAGLHRCADSYDLFDAIEDEVRKRTFWCVYIWDKQLAAHFGRPPMIRVKDCDVSEPAPVDDEFITRDGIGIPSPGTECRLTAFICSLRIMVVLESVLNVSPIRSPSDSSSFLLRATSALSGSRRSRDMRDEEALLDEIHRSIPAFWSHTAETLASDDTIRLTQAERLHCAEQYVRLLIYRHRFSELLAERTSRSNEEEPSDQEKEALVAAQNSALQIISAHLNIAKKGLMTYYGVHVIHQLTQAGRTLVAILLSCKTEALQHLIPTGLDALRSCVGLLRRFSGRYVCGLRSGDLMEEFCRITQIPLETTRQETAASSSRPPWIRPVRKKAPSAPRSTSADSPSQHSSPESYPSSDFFTEPPKNGSSFPANHTMISKTSPTPQVQVTSAQSYPHSDQSQSSFMDTSGGMGMDMIREDPQMYMSPAEMMALFDDGGVDVAHLFSPGFMPHQNQQLQGSNGLNNGGEGFSNPGFMKHNGLVASP